jgi:hypothetical protein
MKILPPPIQDITLRDYFASQAMAGLINNGMHPNIYQLASDAYRVADAMIEARKNDPA